MTAHVIVIGSINVDLVVAADRLPAPGETVLGGRFSIHDGGKGANQAVAAARAGARVSMIGAVGGDAHGARSIAALEAEGVDTSRIRRVESEQTGVAIIAVGPRGENQIVVAPGANATLVLDDADRELIGSAQVILTNHEIPPGATLDALRTASAAGVTAILNPAPARALPSEILALGPILTPNEHELVVAIGNDVTGAALDELQVRHAGPIIVTQGPAGVLLVDGPRRERFEGVLAPQVVDTTGAGDAFCGVLAAWLASGHTLDEAIVAANLAGALSVGAAGAREGLPRREAIEGFSGGADPARDHVGDRAAPGAEMAADRTDSINALLVQAEEAHGAFEATELNGVYDQDWARWYAAYAVEHGIDELVGHPVTTDRLAQFLASANVEYDQAQPKPDEPWAAYVAGRIVAEL